MIVNKITKGQVEGALNMFARSQASRGVRYEYYLSDGDCKGFDQVVASKPYGEEIQIKKIRMCRTRSETYRGKVAQI